MRNHPCSRGRRPPSPGGAKYDSPGQRPESYTQVAVLVPNSTGTTNPCSRPAFRQSHGRPSPGGAKYDSPGRQPWVSGPHGPRALKGRHQKRPMPRLPTRRSYMARPQDMYKSQGNALGRKAVDKTSPERATPEAPRRHLLPCRAQHQDMYKSQRRALGPGIHSIAKP